MGELRSAIEVFGTALVPIAELPDARVEEDLTEALRAVHSLEVILLGLLAESDRRQLYAKDGHLSTASWLASTHKSSWGIARAQVATARALEQMPVTLEALKSAEVSMSAAKMLASVRETDTQAFQQAEPYLVEAAKIHSLKDLGRAVDYWRQRAELDSGAQVSHEELLRERRRLHVSVTLRGMVRIDGDMDPESGETVMAAVNAFLDAEAHSRTEEDTRTPAQRRCDALVEIARQSLDRPEGPTVAGERPHLTVTVDAAVLAGAKAGGDEGLCELDHVGPVSPDTAMRLACDASVMRVVMSADSQPLDVGRRTAVVPAPMRRAVIVRDRHCRFPGCDRPQTWCDAHHVVHWARGGPTAASNLLLLCRRHHRLIHGPSGFRLTLEHGRPVFRRPDGARLHARPPRDEPGPGRDHPPVAPR